MNTKQAITKAVENGYSPVQTVGRAFMIKNTWGQQEKFGRTWEEEKTEAIIFLDPLFWKSLGVGLGWHTGEYKQRAAGFMEAVVAEGKTADAFFDGLS